MSTLALVILDGTCFSAKSFVLVRLLDLCFGHYSFPSCCATFGHISNIGSPFVYFFTALVFPLSPGNEGRFEVFGGSTCSLDIVVYPVMNFIFWLWGQNKWSDRYFTIWYWGVLPVRSNMDLVYSMWKGGSLWFPVKSTSEAICPSCLLSDMSNFSFQTFCSGLEWCIAELCPVPSNTQQTAHDSPHHGPLCQNLLHHDLIEQP